MVTLQATLWMGAWIALAGAQGAQPNITYARIVDNNTPIPGGTGSFISMWARPPAIDDTNIAFRGSGLSGQGGIYAHLDGSLVRLADKNTPIPGGTANFGSFSSIGFSVDGSRVAFFGNSTSHSGIFTYLGGQLANVVDNVTPLPAAGGIIGVSFGPTMDSGNIAFAGRGPVAGSDGVYLKRGDNPITRVASELTTVPGKSVKFRAFGRPALSGENIAFMGQAEDGHRGLYRDSGGGLVRVADNNTPIPMGVGTFTSISQDISIDGGQVAFWGGGSGHSGVYKDVGGLQVVADVNTLVPGRSGSFNSLTGGVSISGGEVAFMAFDDLGRRGVYAEFGDELVKVISIDDMLDGRMVNNLNFHIEGRSGDNVAFSVGFTDGFEAIYVANLPEPVTFTWLLAGAMAVLRRRRAS